MTSQAKQAVLAKYPKAVLHHGARTGLYFVLATATGQKRLASFCESEKEAWACAAKRVQGEIK